MAVSLDVNPTFKVSRSRSSKSLGSIWFCPKTTSCDLGIMEVTADSQERSHNTTQLTCFWVTDYTKYWIVLIFLICLIISPSSLTLLISTHINSWKCPTPFFLFYQLICHLQIVPFCFWARICPITCTKLEPAVPLSVSPNTRIRGVHHHISFGVLS